MPVVHEYNVVPVLPPPLEPLKELARNLHWTWDHDIIELFRRPFKQGVIDFQLQKATPGFEAAWRELAGKQPALWTVADLFAALRRIIDNRLDVDLHDLMSAQRDVWAGMTLPHGRMQLDNLWAVLVFARQKTKK